MKAPMAHSVTMDLCSNPRCQSVHLTLLDKHGERIAEAALFLKDIPGFVAALQAAAYKAAAIKESP